MDMIMLALAAAVSVLVSPAMAGFAPPTAQLSQTADGVKVHGAVCRQQILAVRAPREVRLSVIDAQGGVLSTTTTPLTGSGLSGKAIGCAYYTAHLKGPMSAGVRIVVAPASSN
jgi:hypothetical protein